MTAVAETRVLPEPLDVDLAQAPRRLARPDRASRRRRTVGLDAPVPSSRWPTTAADRRPRADPTRRRRPVATPTSATSCPRTSTSAGYVGPVPLPEQQPAPRARATSTSASAALCVAGLGRRPAPTIRCWSTRASCGPRLGPGPRRRLPPRRRAGTSTSTSATRWWPPPARSASRSATPRRRWAGGACSAGRRGASCCTRPRTRRTRRGLVLVDGVDGEVVDWFVEDNPEDWSDLKGDLTAGRRAQPS